VQICDGNSVGQLQVIRACGAVTGEKSAGAGNVFQIPAGAGWGQNLRYGMEADKKLICARL